MAKQDISHTFPELNNNNITSVHSQNCLYGSFAAQVGDYETPV